MPKIKTPKSTPTRGAAASPFHGTTTHMQTPSPQKLSPPPPSQDKSSPNNKLGKGMSVGTCPPSGAKLQMEQMVYPRPRPRPSPIYIRPSDGSSTISLSCAAFDGSGLDSVEKLWLRHHYPLYLDVQGNSATKIAFLERVAAEFLKEFPNHLPRQEGSRHDQAHALKSAKKSIIPNMQSSLPSSFGPVLWKLGVAIKGNAAYVPCDPATQPEPDPRHKSLCIFMEDLAPVFDIVTNLSEMENHRFMEKVRIAWFSIWPLKEDNILAVLEKEDVELEAIHNKLKQKRATRGALRARNSIKPLNWEAMFHECIHSSRYTNWALYIPPSPGPIVMKLDLEDPEDWFEFATLAICDPMQTQWCKGYRVWSSGPENLDEEEATDEETESSSAESECYSQVDSE
ncbi:hypothetical protein GYMLUDRAFT_251041 [Collybiopsis luxurians FD-317 M1]|uniref:Uncharacterized protein n=1 Tax=Collybiopsis luxurians FD-317 M1 TaxID=944289 RepID=A0A0D0AQR0_9AGAR|nr:hypothetical protein GYMLUDRAFT_251041 [Collybiopsis luxurians FD-317 M1]